MNNSESANENVDDGTVPHSDPADGRQRAPAGQGQHGEEYGVYGRGATEGGRYADHGDGPADVNPPQRNLAQQDIARKDGQPHVSDHADPSHIPPRGQTAEEAGLVAADESGMNEVGRGSGGERYLEGQSAPNSVRNDQEALVAPRETTWKQNSGAETDFGGMRPATGRDAANQEQ